MIYLACFLVSCVFLWLSEKSKNQIASRVLAIIGILLPCVLAGLRADTIGTDVKVYVEPMYNAAKETSGIPSYMNQKWYELWRYMYVRDFEIGFSLLIFLIAKLGGSLGTVLFAIQVLIIVPMYLGLRKSRKQYPTCVGMLVFYCMFYNTSLNMMRQWIAMSIIFLGFTYLVGGSKKKYCAFLAVALLFHTSAIIGIVVLFIYVYSTKKREYVKIARFKLHQSMVPIKVFVYGCIGLLSVNVIVFILSKTGLSKYMGYIQGVNGIYLLPNQIILRLPIIVLLIIRWKRILKEDRLAPFYGSMMVLDLLASQLMSINMYAFRIASYFSEYNVISFPALVYAGNRKHRANRYVAFLYVLIYIVYYWIYYYAITGMHATYPYMFA